MKPLHLIIPLVLAIVLPVTVHGAEQSISDRPYTPDAPVEVLQYTSDHLTNLIANHGRLCQKLLKRLKPIIDPMEIRGLEVHTNFAGIITAQWRQPVMDQNGKNKSDWNFECVSKVLAGNKLVVISLATYQERAGSRRGFEFLSRRNIRVEHIH